MKAHRENIVGFLLVALVVAGCFFLPQVAGAAVDHREGGSKTLTLDESVTDLPEQTFAPRLAAVRQADVRAPLQGNSKMNEQQAQLTGINELELLYADLDVDVSGEVWPVSTCCAVLYINESAEISVVCWKICYQREDEELQVILDDETGKILALSCESAGQISTQKSPADMAEDYLHYLSWIWDNYNITTDDDNSTDIAVKQSGYSTLFSLTLTEHSMKINWEK